MLVFSSPFVLYQDSASDPLVRVTVLTLGSFRTNTYLCSYPGDQTPDPGLAYLILPPSNVTRCGGPQPLHADCLLDAEPSSLRSLGTTLPANYSLDWAPLSDATWQLTLTDRRNVQFTQICQDSERRVGVGFMGSGGGLELPGAWARQPPTAPEGVRHSVGMQGTGKGGCIAAHHAWRRATFLTAPLPDCLAVSQASLTSQPSAQYSLQFFDVATSSFGAQAFCFYGLGAGISDYGQVGRPGPPSTPPDVVQPQTSLCQGSG